jgi:ABC-type branched-subunit amino acid transport system substrate-binding protein
VLNNHVFAAAPVATDVLSAASTEFLVQNHTPLLGYAVTSPWCNNPWAFGVTGCQQNPHVQSNAAANEIIKAFGKPASEIRLAMEGLNIQAAQSVGKTLAKVWQTTGAQVVFNESQIPLAQSVDYTPFVQSILASKPNVVFEVTDAATAIALAGALKAGGYTGLVYNGSTYLPTQLASQPNVAAALDGVYTVNLTPTQVDGTPAVKQEQDDLQAIGSSPDIQIGTGVGYWTAEMFIQMLQATAAKGPVTPEAFQQTVNAGLTIQPPLAGGNGPLKFPEYLNEPQPCNSLIQAKGNHYVSKIPFTCFQNVQVP